VFTDLVADGAEPMPVALVAGATRGAGRAIAVELARAGFFVHATGRGSRAAGPSEIGRPETIEESGDLIGAAGGAGAARVVDHEDPSQVAALVAAIDDERGRLDVLVNDIFGGDRYIQWDKPLWEHDLHGGLRMLRMGVHTHLITCRASIPVMLRTAASDGTRGLVVEMTDGTSQANAEAECRSSRASTTDRSAKELIYTPAPDAECTLGGLVSLAEPEPLIRIVRRSQPIAFARSPAERSPTERCVHISHERALPRKRLVKPCTKRLV
jgi:NAD(P)-dependent dehydrogenase (short-subunit alcohol dehydrogenase family)